LNKQFAKIQNNSLQLFSICTICFTAYFSRKTCWWNIGYFSLGRR